MYTTPEEQTLLDLSRGAPEGATTLVSASWLFGLILEAIAYRERLGIMLTQPTDADLYYLATSGDKIRAIKMARERHHLTLRDAVSYVNALLTNPPAGAVETPAELPDHPGQEG